MARISALASRLTPLEIYFISAGVMAGVLDDRLAAPALGIAVIFWIARWLAPGNPLPRTPADLAIVLLTLAALGSLFISVQKDLTQLLVLKLILSVALYYAVVNWTKKEAQVRTVKAGFVLLGVALALIAPFSVEWVTIKIPLIPASIYENFSQIVSDSIHRNVMAGYLVILLSLIIGWLIFGWQDYRSRGRAALFAAVVLIFAILVLTQSRGALAAFGVILLAAAVMYFRRGWLLIPLSIVAVALLVRLVGVEALIDRFSAEVSLEGWQDRFTIWSRALAMLQDFPITGVGMGLFGITANTLYPDFFSGPRLLSHAHNLYLQVAVDLGIPGLIAWLGISILAFHQSWQLYHRGRSLGRAEITGIGAGLLLGQLALVTHGLLDAVTWGRVKPAPIIWGIWALAFAAGKVYLHRQAGDTVNNEGEQSA